MKSTSDIVSRPAAFSDPKTCYTPSIIVLRCRPIEERPISVTVRQQYPPRSSPILLILDLPPPPRRPGPIARFPLLPQEHRHRTAALPIQEPETATIAAPPRNHHPRSQRLLQPSFPVFAALHPHRQLSSKPTLSGVL